MIIVLALAVDCTLRITFVRRSRNNQTLYRFAIYARFLLLFFHSLIICNRKTTFDDGPFGCILEVNFGQKKEKKENQKKKEKRIKKVCIFDYSKQFESIDVDAKIHWILMISSDFGAFFHVDLAHF